MHAPRCLNLQREFARERRAPWLRSGIVFTSDIRNALGTTSHEDSIGPAAVREWLCFPEGDRSLNWLQSASEGSRIAKSAVAC